MKKVTNGIDASYLPDDYAWQKNRGDVPICVCAGVGVDSTAMLIGLHQRGIRPDLITFADVGAEKPETYLFVPILRQWLRDVGFPDLVVVRNRCPRSTYQDIQGNMLQNQTLPSISFGMKSCSMRWKVEPQNGW